MNEPFTGFDIGGLFLILGSQLPWVSFSVHHGVEGPAYEALEIGWEGAGTMTIINTKGLPFCN